MNARATQKTTKAESARGLANIHFKKLGVSKMPCERCGVATSLKHHEDYEKPLEVMWLCCKHHSERHKELGWGTPYSGPSKHSRPNLNQVRIQGCIADKLLSSYKNKPFAPSLSQLVNCELAAALDAKRTKGKKQ
jgi:hypothetical protein